MLAVVSRVYPLRRRHCPSHSTEATGVHSPDRSSTSVTICACNLSDLLLINFSMFIGSRRQCSSMVAGAG